MTLQEKIEAELAEFKELDIFPMTTDHDHKYFGHVYESFSDIHWHPRYRYTLSTEASMAEMWRPYRWKIEIHHACQRESYAQSEDHIAAIYDLPSNIKLNFDPEEDDCFEYHVSKFKKVISDRFCSTIPGVITKDRLGFNFWDANDAYSPEFFNESFRSICPGSVQWNEDGVSAEASCDVILQVSLEYADEATQTISQALQQIKVMGEDPDSHWELSEASD